MGLTIVKTAGVPSRVFTALATVEVEIVGTVETAKSFCLITHRMRVYNVKQYAYAQAVGSINEFFEFFRGAKARTYRKEVSHLIAKRTVVRVFLYCHQLDSVVTQSSNAR